MSKEDAKPGTSEDRIITVVLRVKDQKSAEAFWCAHANSTRVYGCAVEAIGSGDYTKKYDRALEELGTLSEYYQQHSGDEWEPWDHDEAATPPGPQNEPPKAPGQRRKK